MRAAEHRRLFGHTVAHGCPPYETEYGRRHVFGQAQELGDVSGFYAAFGLRPAPSGERPDHIACELEFLAVVALKEAYARARTADAQAGVARDGAAAFLRDHLGRWLPAFAALARQRAPGSGYAVLGALAARLVADHATEFGVAPDRLAPGDLRPIDGELDGLTFACGVDEADPAIPG
jgi:TorA maturation chaperone TorD